MPDVVEGQTMEVLAAAKQQLRAAMKQKLKAVPRDSIVSQSTALSCRCAC